MNANAKSPQMEHCSCPKNGMILAYTGLTYTIGPKKKYLKNGKELKFTFQNMPLLNNLQYHCPKI